MSDPAVPTCAAGENEGAAAGPEADAAAENVVDISLVHDPGTGLSARIVNVTTVHYLMWEGLYYDQPVTVNLANLAEHTRAELGLAFDPCAMPAAKSTIDFEPLFGKTTVALYKTGKVVQTGCRAPEQARLAAAMFAKRALGKYRLKFEVRNFTVVNMVAMVQFDESFDPQRLKAVLGARCKYEDEGSYRAARVDYVLGGDQKATFLVWGSGKALLVGVLSRAQVVQALQVLHGWVKATGAVVLYNKPPAMSKAQLAEGLNDAMKRIMARVLQQNMFPLGRR